MVIKKHTCSDIAIRALLDVEHFVQEASFCAPLVIKEESRYQTEP